jgi:hypothetical protein
VKLKITAAMTLILVLLSGPLAGATICRALCGERQQTGRGTAHAEKRTAHSGHHHNIATNQDVPSVSEPSTQTKLGCAVVNQCHVTCSVQGLVRELREAVVESGRSSFCLTSSLSYSAPDLAPAILLFQSQRNLPASTEPFL